MESASLPLIADSSSGGNALTEGSSGFFIIFSDEQTCDMAYWFIFLPGDRQTEDLNVVIRTVDLYESDMGPLMR